MTKDIFELHPVRPGDPWTDAFPITPNDATDLEQIPLGIYVGVSGDVCVVMKSGREVTYKNLAQGVSHGIRAVRVKATGTTATNLLAVL